ncbi:unnamed protein product [Prorocentrum cordatum]|uniref:ShKT domain-containing protein n=1 Tax=Prorocentrum cordatum TaxID=2364126 RepID=A0ABN9U708_9DINO|nr:unnamed protein product [Polarella glacialis]
MLTTRAVEERLAFLGPGASARSAAPLGRRCAAATGALASLGCQGQRCQEAGRTRRSRPGRGPDTHARRSKKKVASACWAPSSWPQDRFPLEPAPSCFPCWCSSEGELRSCGVAADMKYSVLSLAQAGITHIRPGAFSPSTFASSPNMFSEASLRGNRLRTMEIGTFQHMTELTWLDLRDNGLDAIAPGAFDGLERLQHLLLDISAEFQDGASQCTLPQCKLPPLKAGVFRGLSQLRTLGLCSWKGQSWFYTGVPSVEPGVFSGLDSLEVLRMHGAFDEPFWQAAGGRLPPGLFAGLGRLRVLVLGNARLPRLGPEDLAGTPGLRGFLLPDLRDNPLYQVQPGTFQGLAQLRLLDMSRCGLVDLQPGTFAGLAELRHLSLSQGCFRQLRAGAFAGLENLEELDLSSNEFLALVAPGALDDLSSPPLQSLSLKGTPLQGAVERCAPWDSTAEHCSDSFLALWRLTRNFFSDVFVNGLGCSEVSQLCGNDQSMTQAGCPVTCGLCDAVAADASQADGCEDRDWVLDYVMVLMVGLELPLDVPGAPGSTSPLSTWSTCADVAAAGACDHPFWLEAATLLCPVACGLCDAYRQRSCTDFAFFAGPLGDLSRLCSGPYFEPLCSDLGPLGDLARLLCPSTCGECSAVAGVCDGAADSLTLGEGMEFLNAGVQQGSEITNGSEAYATPLPYAISLFQLDHRCDPSGSFDCGDRDPDFVSDCAAQCWEKFAASIGFDFFMYEPSHGRCYWALAAACVSESLHPQQGWHVWRIEQLLPTPVYIYQSVPEYIGCYVDDYYSRVFNQGPMNYGYTVFSCSGACAGVPTTHLALQDGGQCWCGSAENLGNAPYLQTANGECGEPSLEYGIQTTDGPQPQRGGGALRNAVYTLPSVSTPTSGGPGMDEHGPRRGPQRP